MMECNIKANQVKCKCTYEPCSRKGKCCECLSYHLAAEELPACAFSPDIERTYDRSFSRFVSMLSDRKK